MARKKKPDPVVTKPQPGDPFVCPNCGSEDWRVSYPESAHQDVEVIVGEDGEPEIADYLGNTGTYSDGDGDNEELSCNECDHVITFGYHFFMTPEEEARLKKIESILTELKVAQDEAAASGLGINKDVAWGAISDLVELAKPAV